MKISTKVKAVILVFVIILGVGYYLLFKHMFSEAIRHEVSANVYVNGKITGQTVINIDGERIYTLISDYRTSLLNYYGVFGIACYGYTNRDGTQAHVYATPDRDLQNIIYYRAGDFGTFDLKPNLLINRDMDEFAIGFKDGSVIATSDELYQSYIQCRVLVGKD